MNKKVVIGAAVVIVVLLALWMNASKKVVAPEVTTTDEFSQELSGLDSVNLEADLKAMDADLNTL
jgi:hypothetical protein